MMANAAGNIFAKLPQSLSEEVFQEIIHGERFRLERIISFGQATRGGQWYDQEQHEWVVLLSGAAGLRFAGEEGLRVLNPGDFVNIPAHTRHRVEWTDEKQSTVWLALHYSKSDAAQ
jgi:cupin 2 domain-containing protein